MAMGTELLTADKCFTCRSGERHLYWHHVLQVQHGGSNHPRNFVRICALCHKRVHPWLPMPDTMENRRGWVLIGDYMRHVTDAVAAAWKYARPLLTPSHITKKRQRKLEPDDDQPF